MALRAILLVALAALLFGNILRADNPTLPSRRASVVIPLIYKISPNASPKEAFDQIEKILGHPDSADAGGPSEHSWCGAAYGLDDKTSVAVNLRMKYSKFESVEIAIPSQKWKHLYSAPKT